MVRQMLSDLATGHTWNGGDGPYTLAPLVGSILTVLLIRSIVRQRIGIVALAISVVLGALFATIGGALGYTLTIATWVVGASLVGAILRSARGSFRGNPSD
jgi:ABC-type Co2+ transport system permease subunit